MTNADIIHQLSDEPSIAEIIDAINMGRSDEAEKIVKSFIEKATHLADIDEDGYVTIGLKMIIDIGELILRERLNEETINA